MTATPDPDRRPAVDAEFRIDHLRPVDETRATAAVRCTHGPVRLGARFHRLRDAAAPIDLVLTRIVFYGRPVDALDPACTALVTLRGAGTTLLAPGAGAGPPTIQGAIPPPCAGPSRAPRARTERRSWLHGATQYSP
ncbi:hypothetical protein [Streptomyces sp. 2P-4]|uniref:hypothetical protein n=1 Tax=Streptomyces sp. 2P-4 TaxID=2931974 RepID=UPI0025415EB2|nr:hypothetical protein [Streptomyces sp. 2P-4]